MIYTLLDYVQSIASSLESDAINSINDSIESQQIANVVRNAYYDIISRQNIPEHYTFFNLQPSLDNTKPTLMYVPDNVSKVLEIKYNTATATDTHPIYSQVTFMNQYDFFNQILSFDPTADGYSSFVQTIDTSTFTFFYRNDRGPSYYTTFDDNTLVFDAYDSNVDTTLTSAKSWGYGRKIISWTMTDAFIPFLQEQDCQLLMNEAKALAWTEMKQSQHPKAEQNARRLLLRSQKNKSAADAESDFDKLPNFGRK